MREILRFLVILCKMMTRMNMKMKTEFCFTDIRYNKKYFFIQEKLKIENVLYSWEIIARKHDSRWALKQSDGPTRFSVLQFL